MDLTGESSPPKKLRREWSKWMQEVLARHGKHLPPWDIAGYAFLYKSAFVYMHANCKEYGKREVGIHCMTACHPIEQLICSQVLPKRPW